VANFKIWLLINNHYIGEEYVLRIVLYL